MKRILYIKSSSINDVRMNKFYKYFSYKEGYSINFIGWDRYKKYEDKTDSNIQYVKRGIFFPLIIEYCLFMIVLFFRLLFLGRNKYSAIICINFETALPAYVVSKIRNLNFSYEIYDEFSKSYNFPLWLKRYLQYLDRKILKKADFVVHVDNNRIIGPEKGKYVVIENAPNDFYVSRKKDYTKMKHRFAIIGFFSEARGMEQIYSFAKSNPNIEFLLAGRFTNDEIKRDFETLENVNCNDFMPQMELFRLLEDCCAIFSLYNPNLEINRLAASNKVYDAMMMGIPVITNKEVLNAKMIEENNIGIVLDYTYNDSWSLLLENDFLSLSEKLGKKGRKLYEEKYSFEQLVERNLIPLLEQC